MTARPSLAAGIVTLESGLPGAPLTPESSLRAAQRFVDEAERLGFSHVWVGEQRSGWTGPCSSALVAIGGLLSQTSAIAFSSAFVNVAARPTEELVTEAHRLAVASAGRFELGIGCGQLPHAAGDATTIEDALAELLHRWQALYPRVALWVSAGDADTAARAAQAGARIVLPSYLERDEVRSLTEIYREAFPVGDEPVVAVIRDCCLNNEDLAFIREAYTAATWLPTDELESDVLIEQLLQRVAYGSPSDIAKELAADKEDGIDHIVVRTAIGGRADLEPLRLLASESTIREWLCEPSYS
jgi:alkanesulfonate monooxygenase SsuD/methylene tetrahydromethanopterin reductase-like flavin-dependent oxidoreductase (luciferase family)